MLVPTHLWKVVYSPKRRQAGAYLITNDETTTYSTLSVAELERMVGIQALPGVEPQVRDTAMALPAPGTRSTAPRSPRPRGNPPGRARASPRASWSACSTSCARWCAEPQGERVMEDFRPYANEGDVLTVGNLSIENRVDRVTLMGDVELTRDRKGLALARHLKAVLDATVKALEADKALPEEVPVEKPRTVKNPFG